MLVQQRRMPSMDLTMEEQQQLQRTKTFPEGLVEKIVAMVPEEPAGHLPQDLVDKIVSMMPYPSIFKARMLSNSWLVKFSSVETLDAEVEKHLATTFQKQVVESSSRWDSFCPISLDGQQCCAYDQASHSWRRNLDLSFLPKHLVQDSYMQMHGALLFMSSKPTFSELLICSKPLFKEQLSVANALTWAWKELPPRPYASESRLHSANVVGPQTPSSQGYKIIAFCGDCELEEKCFAQIYDSESNAWSKKFVLEGVESIRPSVYLDGVLYMLGDMNRLFAFHMEKGTTEELDIPVEPNCFESSTTELVGCDGTLVVVEKEAASFDKANYRLLKIDLVSRKLAEVARGPPAALNVGDIKTKLVSNGDSIFFGSEEYTGRVLMYNVREDNWSCLPSSGEGYIACKDGYSASVFQPGLNPFVSV